MKADLLEDIGIFLLKQGFTVKALTRNCFDLVARRQDFILLVKALEDANSISHEHAIEMASIASFFSATPLTVAEKAGERLIDGVVYSRLGIYTISFNTFRDCINQRMPLLVKDNAGLKVYINSDKVKGFIEASGLSLNSVAKKLGVSRKMVQRYVAGQADITLKNAQRLYDLFGTDVFRKVDLLSPVKPGASKPSGEIAMKYSELGFDAANTRKVPFDVIAKKEDALIITEVGDNAKPEFQSIGRLVDADNLVIFRAKKPKGIPALTKEEFLDFEEADELIKFLREF